LVARKDIDAGRYTPIRRPLSRRGLLTAILAGAFGCAPRRPDYPVKALPTLPLLNDLRGSDPGVSKLVRVLASKSPGDGGGGVFRWVAPSSAQDDDGTIIACSRSDGRWVRVRDASLNAPNRVSVRWFGAAGDGKRDDTNSLEAAVRAMSTLGGELYFPAGTYLLSRAICLAAAIKLVGEGAVSIVRASDASFHLFEVRASDVSIASLHFQGAATGPSTRQTAIYSDTTVASVSTSNANYAAIKAGDTLIVRIDGHAMATVFAHGDTTQAAVIARINSSAGGLVNLGDEPRPELAVARGTEFVMFSRTAGAESSICVSGGSAAPKLGLGDRTSRGSGSCAERIHVEFCVFSGADAGHACNNALKVAAGCHDWVIRNCEIRQLAGIESGCGYGILVGRAYRVRITENVFSGTPLGGRHFAYLSGGASLCVVSKNHVVGCHSSSITLFSYDHQPVCFGNLVTSNLIDGQSAGPTDTAGISLSGRVANNTIDRNLVKNCMRFGIIESAADVALGRGPVSNEITNNVVMRCADSGIAHLGTDAGTTEGNVIADCALASGTGGTGGFPLAVRSHPDNGHPIIANGKRILRNAIGASACDARYRSAIFFEPGATAPTNCECVGNVIKPGTGIGGEHRLISHSPTMPVRLADNRRDVPVSYVVGSTSPSVLGTLKMSIRNLKLTKLTHLVDGLPQQQITLTFVDSNTAVAHNFPGIGRLLLATTEDFTPFAGSKLRLVYEAASAAWYEIGRS